MRYRPYGGDCSRQVGTDCQVFFPTTSALLYLRIRSNLVEPWAALKSAGREGTDIIIAKAHFGAFRLQRCSGGLGLTAYISQGCAAARQNVAEMYYNPGEYIQ